MQATRLDHREASMQVALDMSRRRSSVARPGSAAGGGGERRVSTKLAEAGIIEEDDEVYHSQVGGTIDSLGMMQKLEKMYQGQKELRKELMDTRDMVKKLQKMSTFGGKTVGDGMS